jgi:transcription elongation GreA/GreB family factor
MASHHQIATRPRSLDNILADIKDARRDYDCALAADDADAEDRATEAETRVEDLRGEFDELLIAATGLSFEALVKAREEALI